MGNIVNALKSLAAAMGCAASISEVAGDTIAEVVRFMAENYPAGS